MEFKEFYVLFYLPLLTRETQSEEGIWQTGKIKIRVKRTKETGAH